MSHRYRYNTPGYYAMNPSGASRNPRVINRRQRPITPPPPKTVYPTDEQIEKKLEYEGKGVVPIMTKIGTYIDSFINSVYKAENQFDSTIHLFRNCYKYAGETLNLAADKMLCFFTQFNGQFVQMELTKNFWWRPRLNRQFETKAANPQYNDSFHVGHYYMILDDAPPYVTTFTVNVPDTVPSIDVIAATINIRQHNMMLGTQYYIEQEGGTNVPALPDGSQGPHVPILFQPYVHTDHEFSSQTVSYISTTPNDEYTAYKQWDWVEIPINMISNETLNFFKGTI